MKPLITPSGKPLLTTGHAVALRRLWDYLATRRPGSSPQARLLALICTPRAARPGERAGTANLTAQDLTGLLKLDDPRAVVEDLVACGWLHADADAVLDAQTSAVQCTVPDLAAASSAPLTVSESARSRLSGWCLRLLSHKRLRKQPAVIRLTAAYTAAHADSTGAGEVDLAHLCAACQLSDDEADAVAEVLREACWFTSATVASGRLRYQLAEDICGFAEASASRSSSRPPKDEEPRAVDERLRLGRMKLGKGLAGDIERALGCLLCAQDGVVNHVPDAHHAPRPLSLTVYAGRKALSGRQAAVLQAMMAKVAQTAPAGGPDLRLAAVWWATRALWSGELDLSAPKVKRIPIPGIRDSLRELAASGWMRVDLDAVAVAADADPVIAAIPDLVGHDPALWLGRDSATFLATWQRRLIRHPLLSEASSEHRLAAMYLTAHADPERRLEVPLHAMAAAIAASPAVAEAAATALHETGWLAQLPAVADGVLTAGLSAKARAVASPCPPVHEPFDHYSPDPAVQEQAAALVEGRQAELARWVADYLARHGHGPSWRILRNAHFEHNDPTYMDHLHGQAIKLLRDTGWLAGFGRPFGLRPGWRHHETPTPTP
ncbi:hypothetical protein ABZW10_05435 [Kitasatospora sp. NPDC004723]|uniref:hypothetical protein n=1 Tax=Kitasatospora sp. NPDC004723 TaxID=3154288 RepID=UPI0033B220ED